MQPVVAPICVHDLWGNPWELAYGVTPYGLYMFCVTSFQLISADHLHSELIFADLWLLTSFSYSLRTFL